MLKRPPSMGPLATPERVVVHVAQVVRRDPPDPPRLVHRQGEVDPVGVLDDEDALDPGEAGERVAEQPEPAVGAVSS